MLYFSRLKITLIIATCLVAIIFSLPSLLLNTNNKTIKSILPDNKVNLGLDLKGGAQLLMQVDFDYYLNEQLVNLTADIKTMFREEFIRALPRVEGDKIIFSVLDNEKISTVKKSIKKLNSRLNVQEDNGDFVIGFSSNELIKIQQRLISQSIEIIRRRIDEDGTKEPTIQAQGKNRILLQVPGVKDSSTLKSILGKTAKMTFQFVVDNKSTNSVGYNYIRIPDSEGYIYKVEKEVILNGDLLIDANATYHQGEPAVAFRFNNLGTKKFAKITKNNLGRIFAIVLDGKVVTAPRINVVINEGSGVISGAFSVEEANEVALLLRAGALPAPLKIIEERTVGPSLGADSIRSGSIAAVASLIMVAIFMIVFYKMFGLFADIALVVNIAIIIAVLSILGATLTLPGIAGIVLTMGMAVDANVLIFERIKEEMRLKKSNVSAIDQGFVQAFRTIVDSNITALIVAFFLFILGNGPVKGFAITLSIGIMASMFSAIMLTRMMISLWLKKNRSKKIAI